MHTDIEGYSDGDIDTNRSSNPTLQEMIDSRYSRRQTLFGGMSATAMAVFGSTMLSACGPDDANGSPTVNAGANATTSSGRVVTLSGTAADSDGINSSTWTQIAGPTVTLGSGSSATVTFLSPSVSADTELKFRFTAVDSKGVASSAETTVTVKPAALGFTAVPKSLADIVTVPAGYTVTVLYRTGDPIAAGVSAYANNGSDDNFAQRAGDHHDGMYYFGLSAGGTPDAASNTRGLMAINHENIAGTVAYMHPSGQTSPGGPRPYAEVIKEIEAHGVSVVEFARNGSGVWGYVQGSAFNRRITPLTPMAINGPVRGNAQMKTLYSTDGTQARGTINNCANGFTPWNTYITCEENWVGYYRRDASDVAARAGTKSQTSLSRYGKGSTAAGNNNWTTATPAPAGTEIAKFDITLKAAQPSDGTGDFRNELNHVGWVVEIDPYDVTSVPRKRTALGRMNHEGAWPGKFLAGVKPAWYMGDDAQNEYLYKFVSSTAWSAGDASNANRLAMGDKYLDAGTLYVARFDAGGSGQWLPLVFGTGVLTAANATYPYADQADVLINARLAADAVGATRMDRPEWTAVNPVSGEVYLTLTNNSSRTVANTDAANPRAYTDPKGAGGTNGNANGHIIRLREAGDTTEATSFTWDVYAYGAGADLDAANINISGLDATNDFSSPDGLWFGRPSNASGLVKPMLWVETDDGAYTDVTNCMLLCGQPGNVGDGTTKTITNTIGGTSGTQTARVGALPGTNLRRFLVGPKEAEITGIDTTPDGRTVFVNIQHPGENGTAGSPSSNWPQSQSGTASGRPRSATIAITKDDGGVVGL
jgi:secreted PhoX family phosphatase